ncbi:nuclear speckle splicing regulatory protein 1 [Neocloeon triangulifer]|uniref:nuclear speckle splicing regulatory protein 1 n=1 Tax=Neocloeon triangulifer TaxID=2078957 RepID=UPI00286EBCEC|nr:nuclear speckle splicing regulatory protein 1 [Neocloeon triangulifer]XP_059480586.1 nuclear speckle splicing regulatory protein 1 [Neocloeon triangulifer]
MSSFQKKYGLTVPKKKSEPAEPSGTLKPRLSCFDEESDDSEPESKKVGQAILKASEKSTQKRATQQQLKRALEEDPTVFQYDEVYENMEQEKAETVAKKKDVSKKPKYIENLLKTAEKRKMENERRVEREVQREREEEGEQFKDKEEFVTSAYRAKLEEFKKQEEKERLEDAIEAITDVTKQKDLSGFYRKMYKDTFSAKEIKKEPEEEEESKPEAEVDEPVKKEERTKEKRKYRARKDSSSSGSSKSENEAEAEKSAAPGSKSSSSGSSSSSSGSSSSESDSEVDAKKKSEGKVKPVKDGKEKVEETVDKTKKDEDKKPIEPVKPKINIWEKRTVGAAFDAAYVRYLQRKSARED